MNSKAFTPEEVKKNLHLDLINYLLSYNQKSKNYYYDIHITTDGYCLIVEWENIPYNHEYGGAFKYIDEDHIVLKQVIFPDNHTEYLFDDEEDEMLKEWLEKNPGWKQNNYGHWYNEQEISKIKEELLNIK